MIKMEVISVSETDRQTIALSPMYARLLHNATNPISEETRGPHLLVKSLVRFCGPFNTGMDGQPDLFYPLASLAHTSL